jgi:predicted dehydrogenase
LSEDSDGMNTNSERSSCQRLSRRAFIQAATSASLVTTAGLAVSAADSATKLKAAVIGHTGRGDYGHGLESIFGNWRNIEMVALADPDPEGRAKTAEKIGAPRSYADYQELLARERPQLVSLAMRQSDQHHAIALAALRAGAHLYCEKPFTTTPAEADELLAEADRRRLKIAVAHTMRVMPTIVRLQQAIANGFLGELVELRAFGKQDARAGGEDMMVLGSHLFDLMRLFLGDPLGCSARVLWKGSDIKAADRRTVKDNVGWVAGDQVYAQFAFPNDVNATFTSTAKLRETVGQWGIELFGSKGAARINCDIAPNVFIRRASPWIATGKVDSWEPLDPALAKAPPIHNPSSVSDWLDAIERDREPECSGRNGAWAVEMVMGVYQSALTGKRATFPLANRAHPLRLEDSP